MAVKTFQTLILEPKEIVIQDIMTMAMMANRLSAQAFSVRYYGPLNLLEVTIAESEEKFNDWLYHLTISTHESSLEDLTYFRDVLRSLINEEEVDVECDNFAMAGINFTDHRNDPPYDYESDDV